MKFLFTILIFINFAFSSSENVSLMNAVKDVIQKEEYISLAINKYILQTGTIPKQSNSSLDWDKLTVSDYLGTNFNKTNPLTLNDIQVVFDTDNSAFIKGAIETTTQYKQENNYLYNFYVNNIFRVNTIPSKSIVSSELLKGSQVLYNNIQKEIVAILNETNPKDVKLANQVCTANNYFYELRNEKLTYKYCKSDNTSIQVYQEEPIYSENNDDLQYIIAKAGAKAYVRIGSSWFEKYFVGVQNGISLWSATSIVQNVSNSTAETSQTIAEDLLATISIANDIIIREEGGCFLAKGDIYCWGNNQYKKSGIETYGQVDTTLIPDYINTPVSLKVQINSLTQKDLGWYNNPEREKFQKIGMNSTNVCGITPIILTDTMKYGGELYCNGQISSIYYENIATDVNNTSILSRNKFFAWGKTDKKDDSVKLINVSDDGGPIIYASDEVTELTTTRDEIYLKDIAMVKDNIAVLSDDGKIYTLGRNYTGSLGISSTDKFINKLEPVAVTQDINVRFKKIYALRDLNCFGAIDSNNLFYIWGELPSTTINKPTKISEITFNPEMIFVNSKRFILKSNTNKFYKTNDDLTISEISNTVVPSDAISVSSYDNTGIYYYLYITKNMQLAEKNPSNGSKSFVICKEANGTTNCDLVDSGIFSTSLNKLNTISTTTNYANFSNVSIFKINRVVSEKSDNFETGSTTGWILKSYNDTLFASLLNILLGSDNLISTTVSTEQTADLSISTITERVNPTRVLGRFSVGNQSVEKTFDFTTTYANREVEVEFDFFEIDSWDTEKFQVFFNGIQLVEDRFIHDNHPTLKATNDTGIYTLNLATHYNSDVKYNDQKFHYRVKTILDGSGKLKIVFRTKLLTTAELNYSNVNNLQSINDESWAIDNVNVKVKDTDETFVCAMTGLIDDSQMYCWGNVGRSIPILSTSLYDVSKISTINKLFISQGSDKVTQMSFDKYNNNGNLFLKYPSYIGGFDYPFYFK